MNNKNIAKLLKENNNEITQLTKTLIENVETTKRTPSSEGDISWCLDLWIRDVAKLLLGEEFKDTDLKKEKSIKLFKIKERNHGEIDTFFNGLIVEYKKIGGLYYDGQVAKLDTQIKGYLNENVGNDGFSTDGIKILIYTAIQDEIGNHSHKVDECKFNAETLNERIIPMLFNIGKRKITTNNLINDFLSGDVDSKINLTGLSRTLFKDLQAKIDSPQYSKTKMFYAEWKEVFKVSDIADDDNVKKVIQQKRNALEKMVDETINNEHKEYLALFSVYTAYSIFLKLVAYQVLCNIKSVETIEPKMKDFLYNLESNEIFRKEKILNLLDGDYFQWYIESIDTNRDLETKLNSIRVKLTTYEVSEKDLYVADIFRNFYEEYINFDIRHSLGEYFTPLWLADFCIDEYENGVGADNLSHNYKLIDNCCGSGAFVLAGINRKLQKNIDYKDIINSVVGIDINPLSALQARINYFIALSTKFEANHSDIVIPIYLADSCNVPTKDEKFVYYELATKFKDDKQYSFKVPLSILDDSTKFFKSIYNVEKTILQNSFTDERKKELIFDEFQKLSILKFDSDETAALSQFIDDLLELQNNKWNGIWARIIANRIFTVKLEKEFDLVVGNPPWVKWGNLPIKYRNDLQAKADAFNLFSQNKFLGGNSLNICSLISYVSLETYGNQESKLVYIMPSDMMFQASYESWRNLNHNQNFEKYISFQNKNIFKDVTMDFSIYVVNKNCPQVIKYDELKLVKKNIDWDGIRTFAEIKTNPNISIILDTGKSLIPVRSDKTKFIVVENKQDEQMFEIIGGKSEYKVRSGLGLLPKESRLFKVDSIDYVNKVAIIESLDSIRNKANTKIKINSDYLFPVLTTEDLSSGNIDLNNKQDYKYYTFLPYDYNSSNKKVFSPIELKVNLGDDFFNDYCLINGNQLSVQSQGSDRLKQDENYGIQRIGTYVYNPNKVILRDNTKFVSSIITKDNFYDVDVNKRVALLNSHVSSISERIVSHGKKPKTELMDKNDAIFINAILNLPLVRKFIENSNSIRGYELNDLGIYLPLFDDNNPYHQNIINAGISNDVNRDSIVLDNYLADCKTHNIYYINKQLAKPKKPI